MKDVKDWLLPGLVLLLLGFSFLSLDLSLEGRYSPNWALKKKLRELEHPIYLDWYISQENPATQELELFLQRLQGRGGLVFRIHDESLDELIQRGYSPYRLNGANAVSAMELEYLGQRYSMPQILDPHLLEERLLANLDYLQGVEKPSIALATGDWIYPVEETHSYFIESLRVYGEPRLLGSLMDLREEKLLIVIGHRDLTPWDVELIKEFHEKGGNLLFLISPLDSQPDEKDNISVVERTPLLAWLEEMGVHLDPQLVLEPQRGLPLPDGPTYPAWYPMEPQGGTSPMMGLWMSPIRLRQDIQSQWLWKSSPQAMLGGQRGSLHPGDLQRDMQESSLDQHILGALWTSPSGKIALLGSQWMVSDLAVEEALLPENLEYFNVLILALSEQQDLLRFRQSWEGAAMANPPWFLMLLLLPLSFPIIGWILLRKRRFPWP